MHSSGKGTVKELGLTFLLINMNCGKVNLKRKEFVPQQIKSFLTFHEKDKLSLFFIAWKHLALLAIAPL